jgi:hypothetical protein
LPDHKIRAVNHPGCEQRTSVFTWCSACKEGFNSEGHLAFAFIRCPLCGAEPKDGFLPWSWVRAHWRNELPEQPEEGVRYEAYPPVSDHANKQAT